MARFFFTPEPEKTFPVPPPLFERLRSLFRSAPEACDHGLLLSGGGARAAYQAGVLQYIAEAFPEACFPILCGVSAGAINAAHLANEGETFAASAAQLAELWRTLRPEQVYLTDSRFKLVRSMLGFGPGANGGAPRRGLIDCSPLHAFLGEHLRHDEGRLTGVAGNLSSGRLRAVAIVTTNYQTGQTVTWVQGEAIRGWERPNRVGIQTQLTLDHIMASTALPLLFPAVEIGGAWYGDGGIRLTAPLSPTIHMGADRILVISTRYARSRPEADEPAVVGYPPAAQIIGVLMNAIFLDMLDQDARMMHRLNELLRHMPARKRRGLRPIRLLVLRPSVDLAKLASGYDTHLEGALGLLTVGLGSRESRSPDWLSMLLFEPEYVARLIEIGYDDARRQRDEIEAFLDPSADVKPLFGMEDLFREV